MDLQKILGSNIKKFRKSANLTQEQLAEKIDITQKHLSHIEVGTRFVSAQILEKLSELLQTPPSEFFYSEELNLKYIGKKDLIKELDNIIKEETDASASRIKDRILKEIT